MSHKMGPYGGWDLIGIIGMKHLALVFAATSIWLTGEAWAAMTGPEKATELLARAWMIDNRCNVLDRDARDELTGFVARAEISLAEKASVKAAETAVAKGRATGTSAPCGEQSAKFVHNVLVRQSQPQVWLTWMTTLLRRRLPQHRCPSKNQQKPLKHKSLLIDWESCI